MMNLVVSSSFRKALKKITKQRQTLRPKIKAILLKLSQEPFDPSLRTHKLKGKLSDSWACSVEYDCRIVFSFESNPETGEQEILLIDIGSHDEVY